MESARAIAQDIYDQLESDGFAPDSDGDSISLPYLMWMCEQIISNADWKPDKAHRWIGYIQGVLVARKLSTVQFERDRTRKYVEK